MGKKLTTVFVKKELEKEGYQLLTKVYVNSKTPLEYVCPKGHYGKITWDSWRQGHRCMECSNDSKKLTIESVKEKFEKEGYQLRTKKYVNAHQKLKYVCPKGHHGEITWSDWQQGHRCAECYHENMKGSNNPRYNPNLTDEERQIGRNIPGYDAWPTSVKERDDFTCQVCGKKGGNLNSHHIESYNNNKDLQIETSNGVCLCETCHKNFHRQYGGGFNTKEQFEEFKKSKKIEDKCEQDSVIK